MKRSRNYGRGYTKAGSILEPAFVVYDCRLFLRLDLLGIESDRKGNGVG